MTTLTGPVSDAEAIEHARCRRCEARKGKPCVYLTPQNPSSNWITNEEWRGRAATNADLREKFERAGKPMKGVHPERRESARTSRWARDRRERYSPLDEPLCVGDILYGFCGGAFGRESYGDKVVEGIGKDWVVAREADTGQAQFCAGDPQLLEEYR